MRKLTIMLSILALCFPVFAQTAVQNKTHKDNSEKGSIILEMKLGAVLGSFKNGKFIDAKTTLSDLFIGQEFSLYGLNVGKNEGEMKLTKIDTGMDDICPEYVGIETDEKAEIGVALSSNVGWNPTPRIPKHIDSNNRVYQGIVNKYLRSKGISKPVVNIQEILRVDLEGDGQEEVFIQASRRSKSDITSANKGDYSFVLMRKIVDGKVKEILLQGEFSKEATEFSAPNTFEISSILDLNGDGKMEIVLFGSYYEGAWSEAFEINDGKANKVLETGCGV